MPPTRTTGRDIAPTPIARPVMDVQRRRREVALTATWLRELRGLTAGAARAGRFTRYR